MTSDNRLPLLIFGLLVALIAIPLAISKGRQLFRTQLLEARVVTATDSDPVLRDGPRRVSPGETVELAVALRVKRLGGSERWLAPGSQLEITGSDLPHVESSDWPDRGTEIRVFWFSVECVNVGGDIDSANAAQRLEYRAFIAPEMGRALRALALPEQHNDDHLGPRTEVVDVDAGTLRLYASVEIFDPDNDVRALQRVSTPGVDRIGDEDFPAVMRSAVFPEGVSAAAGELFRLPGFEPRGFTVDEQDNVTLEAFGRPLSGLAEERLVASSATFAAVAVGAGPIFDEERLEVRGRVEIKDGSFLVDRKELEWRRDVVAGDLLRQGRHWMVLVADDGDGMLGGNDLILHCWRRPPAKTTAAVAIDPALGDIELISHGR